LKKILADVLADVQKGKYFSESLKKHKDIPQMLVNMIEVGEVSGNLDHIMERMAEFYEKENKFNQKVRQATTYPMVVSIFAILVVILLMVKVLPTFVNMLTSMGSTELPLPTKIVMKISDVLIHQGIFILIFIGIIAFLFNSYSKSKAGMEAISIFKMKVPVFGKITKKILTARFARTFGTLMSSGVSLLQSIDICCNVLGNTLVTNALQSSKEEIKRGGSLGEALEVRGIFPPMLTQMIKIGEESGTIDSILVKTAEFYDNEVETVTAQLATMIEPLIIIFLAVMVGFIVLSIILPIFQMYGAVGA
jgi:type IV pilus assembly protein PilC